jgi:tetratricopeptide (TPR) repeat protein
MTKNSDASKHRKLALNIKENPDDSFSKFALAVEFKKMDRFDKARVLFESIRNNDPGYVGVYYHLGKTYEVLGMNRQALITYNEGIEIASANKEEERTVSELKEALAELEMEMN